MEFFCKYPKETDKVKTQQEAVILKKQMDRLSESLREQNIKYEESQKEIARLTTQLTQLLENEAMIKMESEVISKTQTQETSKLNTTLIILKEEISKRKEEINKLQKEKEALSGSDAQRDAVINNLKEQKCQT